jgi:hypothetical protein
MEARMSNRRGIDKAASEAVFRLWSDTRLLNHEEKGFLLKILLREAMGGKELHGDENFLARVLYTQVRKFRRLRDALVARGLIEARCDVIKSLVRSPFENMKYVKLYGREAIPFDLRTAVYERDGYACVWCGCETNLSVDHIIAVTSGGETIFENLRTLCLPCNIKKGAKNGQVIS